jgi:hypothetical protein
VLIDNTPPPPLDTTAPTITVTTPTEGQHFTQGQSVASGFSCNDGSGSGVQTCSGPSSVATTTVGAQQFKVTASDIAGNNATKIVNYVIDAPADPIVNVPPPAAAAPTSTTPPPPPPIGTPLPAPATADTTAPGATLIGASQKLTKAIAVTISCPGEVCTAKTSASVRVPAVGATKAKTYKLSAVRTTLARGQKITIRLKLSTIARTAIKRALRARKRILAVVKLTVTDAAGNKQTLSRQVRLKP